MNSYRTPYGVLRDASRPILRPSAGYRSRTVRRSKANEAFPEFLACIFPELLAYRTRRAGSVAVHSLVQQQDNPGDQVGSTVVFGRASQGFAAKIVGAALFGGVAYGCLRARQRTVYFKTTNERTGNKVRHVIGRWIGKR